MRRFLPLVLVLAGCASTPEAPPDYYGQCVNMGYTGPAVSACAERQMAQDQARRMAAFGLLMQNPPMKWHDVQQMPAPTPIGRRALPCRQVGNQLVCDTQ